MMEEGHNEARSTNGIPDKPNKDIVTVPVDKLAFNAHMMNQRKFHAEALRSIEDYLWREQLITRRIAMAARDR